MTGPDVPGSSDPRSAALAELSDVEVHHGHRRAPVVALADIGLTVAAGERIGVLGASGAGKSTLLGVLGARVLPASGRVVVLGHETGALHGGAGRRIRRRIGTLHQDLALVDSLRVIHNVNAGRLGHWSTARAMQSLVSPRDRANAIAALDAVGIADLADASTGDLSGGQRQRVAIARLIVQDPDLVLADEPVTGLDPTLAEAAVALLCRHVGTGGRGLVMALHDPDLARRHCTRVIGLRAGRMVFDVAADEVDAGRRLGLYA